MLVVLLKPLHRCWRPNCKWIMVIIFFLPSFPSLSSDTTICQFMEEVGGVQGVQEWQHAQRVSAGRS